MGGAVLAIGVVRAVVRDLLFLRAKRSPEGALDNARHFLFLSYQNDQSVIDFMNLGIGRLRTGIFNVADLIILAGIGMVMFRREEKT